MRHRTSKIWLIKMDADGGGEAQHLSPGILEKTESSKNKNIKY
jgi:hypothetical protein